MSEPITLPELLPVMPLPGALLFPHALLPLYIFEPRFRAMLEYALADQRMFCVALRHNTNIDWKSTDDFHHVASVGLIRACVGRGDGTSSLILQGLKRVRFTSFVQEEPFPLARVAALDSILDAANPQTDALAAKVFDLYEKFKGHGRQFPAKVDSYLADLSDPEMLADLMAATFISEPARRQQLLEELNLDRRLRLVIEYVGEENYQPGA